MEVVSKQIEAQAKGSKKSTNWYEKSLAILNSALNLLSEHTTEYLEALVEVARNKRLLAVNKKVIRGIWRQDAEQIDELIKAENRSKLKKLAETESEMKATVDGFSEVKEESADSLLNYQEEAFKSFVQVFNDPDKFKRIAGHLSEHQFDNILASLSLEYAETRGNLNKEQTFIFLAMYQFAVSRQFLTNVYLEACDHRHLDILRQKQVSSIEDNFSVFASPHLPPRADELKGILEGESPIYRYLNKSFDYETEVMERLPKQAAYLILQMSQNKQHLYIGLLKNGTDTDR